LKNYTVAHSPDADDIFMYYAIKFGWIDTNRKKKEKKYILSNIAEDIETLNQKALKNIYDICAGYGPKLIKLKGKKLKPNFKVALSGEYTTNALLFKIAYPKARIIYKNFLEIEDSVLNEEVDAGVLIHESILTEN